METFWVDEQSNLELCKNSGEDQRCFQLITEQMSIGTKKRTTIVAQFTRKTASLYIEYFTKT